MTHNCETNIQSLEYSNGIENLKSVETAFNYADLFEVAKILRDDIVLIRTGPVDPPLLTSLGEKTLHRFADGENEKRFFKMSAEFRDRLIVNLQFSVEGVIVGVSAMNSPLSPYWK